MIKNKSIWVLPLFSFLLPSLVFADDYFNGLKGLLSAVAGILGTVIPIIFALALIYFFWGVAQFILRAGDSKLRDDGKQKMIWSIVALFVMFSIYGILRFIGTALNIEVGTPITLPGKSLPPERLP